MGCIEILIIYFLSVLCKWRQSMSTLWNDFLKSIQSYGFEIVQRRRFKYQSGNKVDKVVQPELIIAAHRQKFLLLSATSYFIGDVERLNSGNVYGTISALGEKLNNSQIRALINCGGGGNPLRREFFFNAQVIDPISKLEEISQVFEYVKWNDSNRFLWLVDYRDNSGSWLKARNKFIRHAPEWVRDFILPK